MRGNPKSNFEIIDLVGADEEGRMPRSTRSTDVGTSEQENVAPDPTMHRRQAFDGHELHHRPWSRPEETGQQLEPPALANPRSICPADTHCSSKQPQDSVQRYGTPDLSSQGSGEHAREPRYVVGHENPGQGRSSRLALDAIYAGAPYIASCLSLHTETP